MYIRNVHTYVPITNTVYLCINFQRLNFAAFVVLVSSMKFSSSKNFTGRTKFYLLKNAIATCETDSWLHYIDDGKFSPSVHFIGAHCLFWKEIIENMQQFQHVKLY